jgi:hypothetical protein
VTPFVSRIDAGLIALCAAAFVLCAVLVAPVVLDSGDLYWHIAAGRWMIDNQAVLRIDPFSSTFAGHAWQTQDWLAEVVLALAYVGAGWGAVLALTAAFAALSAGLLTWFLSRQLQGMALAVVLLLSLFCGAGALLVTPFILALPFAVIWFAGLANARTERRAPSLNLLAVMIVWANLNGSFLAGLVLLVFLGAEAVIEERNARGAALRRWSLFAGFAVIVSMITPYGVEGLAHAIRHVQLSQSSEIRTLLPVLLALPALGVMVQHRAAVKPFRVAILAMLFVLALQDALYQLLFAVSAPLLLAEAVALALGQHGSSRRMPAKPVAVFVGLTVLAIAVRVMMPVARSDGPVTPGSAFERVPATLARSAVLNDIAFGGYLIFHDVRPFIDSRLLYSQSFRARYAQMTRSNGASLATMLTKHHIHWTIFTPANPAVAAMDGLQGWHRLYADRWAVVHVRNGEP